jgi:FkbM family methyltransferase
MLRLLKAPVRTFLQHTGTTYRLKDSNLYRHYLQMFYPHYYLRKLSEEVFYKNLLSQIGSELVFDIGANNGDKTAIFAGIAKKVVCVEPNPKSAAILRRRFARNRAIVIVQKGAGASLCVEHLYQFEETSCFNTFSDKWVKALAHPSSFAVAAAQAVRNKIAVPMTTLDQLVQTHGAPSYVKIDVEGYELSTIRGLSYRIPLISIECNLPEFLPETLELLSILASRFPRITFNYCIEEPPAAFESDQWLQYEAISSVVREGSLRYIELYCRSAV